MPRPIWTGTLSFGLVALAVKLFSATQQQDVRFHELQRGTGERIRHRRVAEGSGDEVAFEDIVKGYEVTRGEYVVVEPEELDAIDPGPPRTIEVEDFIDLDAVDPVYFQKTYHLMPADQGAARAYRLLHRTMVDSGRVAVGRFVMRGKQHLAAVRPAGEILTLETMFFADEVRDPAALDEAELLEAASDPTDRELRTAMQLVDSLTAKWDPERYRDTYREQVLELVQRKAEGEEIVTEEREEPAPVVDLMEALERSIRQAGGRRGRARRAGRSRSRGQDGDQDRDRDLSGMSREELYEEAQRHGIAGRSKMSKDELAAALSEAS